MAAPQRSILFPLCVFTLACAAVMFVILRAVKAPLSAVYLAIPLYFAAITFLVHRWLEADLGDDPKGFVRRFMTGLVMKMFSSIAVLVVFMLLVPSPLLVPFTLSFAVFYLAFLAFSTVRSLRLPKRRPA